MAQFKSASREGSYSDKQLIVPDAVKKLQNEASRRLAGMDNAQAHLEKNQAIFLQAQKQAQGIEQDSKASISNIKQGNIRVKREASEVAYQKELEREQNQAKKKVDLLSNLVGWAPTAIKLAEGIVKQNNELALKTRNQIAFTHKLTHKDVLNAQSVNSSISKAAWQETQVFKDYQKEGKSADFTNTVYEHLVRGGGFRNYIGNSNVLREQATINARVLNDISNNLDLTPEQKRKQLSVADARMRSELAIDGQTPGMEILEKAYNPTMRQALSRAETVVNKDINEKNAAEVRRDEFQILTDAAYPNGKFSATAALDIVSTSPRSNALPDAVGFLISKGLTADELNQLKVAPYIKDGKTYTIANSSPEALALITQAEKAAIQDTRQVMAVEAQQKQLKAEMTVDQMAQDLATDDGLLDNQDYRRIEKTYYEQAGYGADPRILQAIKRQTVDVQLIPVMQENLEQLRLDRNLTLAELDRINPPKQVYDQYIGAAQAQDAVRNSSEYKNIDKYLKERITNSIKGITELQYNDSGPQSDQFNWYVGEQVKKYRKQYMDAALVGTPNALSEIGNQAATESLANLQAKDAMDAVGIVSYRKEMSASTKRQQDAQKKIVAWKGLTPTEQKSPANWLSTIGIKPLAAASQQLSETGSSEVFAQIGQVTGMTVYEVQNEIAKVSKDIEPITINQTYEQIQKAWAPEQRYAFTSGQANDQQRLRTLQQQVNQLENRNSYPVRSTFQPQNTSEGTNLPQEEWESLANQVGFSPAEARIMAAIIMGESGGNTAIDTVKSGLDPNRQGEYSIGGPQINFQAHADKVAAHGWTEDDLRDPQKAMVIAKEVFDEAKGFGPWSVYTKGIYEKFLK